MYSPDLSIEGARAARSVIKQYHVCLNSAAIVPEQGYRMSHSLFPLVCYVNNIMGLFTSKNYHAIPSFIRRAARHMEQFAGPPNARRYYEIVRMYLAQMAYFLQAFTALEESDLAIVPEAIRNAGPQSVPIEALPPTQMQPRTAEE